MTWHFSPTKLGQAYDIASDDGANIATVYGPADGGPADFRKNARLIAAAPDLLELLVDVVRLFDTGAATITPGSSLPSPRAILDCARLIIASAEGRS